MAFLPLSSRKEAPKVGGVWNLTHKGIFSKKGCRELMALLLLCSRKEEPGVPTQNFCCLFIRGPSLF